MTALWAWSRKGQLVSTDDSPAALDDLEWLKVTPDETIPVAGRTPDTEVVAALVEAEDAYACYCTPAELREMPATPHGSIESIYYDGRCRNLSEDDMAALSKAGRKPCYRLKVATDPTSGLAKRLHKYVAGRVADFVILTHEGTATAALSAAQNDQDSKATHCLLHTEDLKHLHQRVLMAAALGFKSPEFSFISDAEQTTGGTGPRHWLTVSGLRDSGFHPDAVRYSLLAAGWPDAKKSDFKRQAAKFKLASLPKQTTVINLDDLQEANSSALHGMDDSDRVDAVFAHLARRGFSFEERDKRWRKKFVSMVVEDMNTLSDAENMAAYVLTPTVDYDKRGAELLREDKTQKLIDTFEGMIKKGKTKSVADWKRTLTQFRTSVDVPGRALATIRLVLTGERAGPNLITLMVLLGEEGTRTRLDKARKYRS